MPDGKAMIAIPTTEDKMLILRPMSDIGYKSPYPTVVRVHAAQ